MTEQRTGFPWMAAGWLLLVVSGAILAALDSPTIPYVALALAHVGGGVVWLFPLAAALWRGEGRWLRLVAALAWAASAGTAFFLIARGNLTVYRPVLRAHVAASVLGSLALLVLLARRRHGATPRERRLVQAGAGVLAIALLAVPGWHQWRRARPRAADRVVNPLVPPASMEDEGQGPRSPFFPSSVRTDPGGHIDAKFFLDSEACGRCHPDVFKQWNESAHHFSSFNNQWYRKSIEYMQSVAGVPASRWCAGCHDPAPLFSGLMDQPVQQILGHPQAQAGLSCTACHAIARVHSTMGQGDYTIRYPPLHHLLTSGNPLMQKVHDAVTYLDPAPHRETFMRPFMREASDRFCSGCHKVHLDVPVNSYRWFRGFNEYDAWQNSGISMNNARAFYHPKEARTCADCHMPRVPSADPAAKNGMIRSHRFVAANTALPTANGHPEQLRLTQEFLQAGKLSVDIFAVSDAAEAAPEGGGSAGDPALQAASLSMSEDVTPAAGASRAEAGTLRGPFRRAPVQVRRGESVRVEVVVRTRDVGHLFPGGTMDAFDVWLELQGVDEAGRVVFWSGEAAEGGQGRVEPGAHRYHTALIDARGNPINKRNAWSARALVYARAIPPGAADTVHFRLKVPPDCGNKITLQARLNYRKFSWWNTHWAYAGRRDAAQGSFELSKNYDDGRWTFDADTAGVSGPMKRVPDLPTTIVARDTQTLEVLPAGAPLPAAGPILSAEDRGRWNDYAIGLLLQGNLKAAQAAFLTVTRLDPAYADGWVNVARCRLEEGDTAGARAVLDKALGIDPGLAKAHYFMGQALKRDGDLHNALRHLGQASERFPGDRVIHDEMGRILFLLRRYGESVEALQKTLAIDPEDLAAHYNLMLSYRGLGNEEQARRHEALYLRFKADEPSQALLGPYLRRNPDDNNERQPIHEHRDPRTAAVVAKPSRPAYTKTVETR